METTKLVIIDNLPDGTSSIEEQHLMPFWKTEDGHKTTELYYLDKFPPVSPFLKVFQEKFDFNLAPGSVRFGHSVFPPFAKVKSCYEKQGHSVEKETYGMHNTTTIDFLVLTKGEQDLVTENGTVHLKTGDCVVQKATVHAWINPGNETAELVYVMLGA